MAQNLSAAAKKHKQNYDNQFNRDNYDRLAVFVPKGEREKIKAFASARGESLNAYINRAIKLAMEADAAGEE
jgi:predicted HicB family RNase H-like nuclease